jgi:hypothetical protein
MSILLFLLILNFNSISDRVEDKAISKILALPEIKTKNRFIDSSTNHQRGIAIMVINKPANNKDYFWIQAGNNTPLRFEPIYNFYVYLPNLEVKYFDPVNNQVISLQNWRKKKSNQ